MKKNLHHLKSNKMVSGGIVVAILLVLTFVLLNLNGNVHNANPKNTIHATSLDTLTLSPSSGSYSVSGSLVITVDENSGTDAINAAEADLTYNSSELQFVSAACSSTFGLSGQASGGSGTVSLACADANSTVTGAQTVGTVTFTVISGGSSVIAFASTSSLILASNQTNVWDGLTTGGTYTIATAPTASISSPAPSAVVHGSTLAIDSTAGDVIGVTKAELNVDGTLVATDTSAPYNFSLNTSGYRDGNHSLTTTSFDAAGLSTNSSAVTVFFNNGDINGDDHVNISDLAILASNWGKTSMSYTQGDLNGDGKVSISDLSVLADYYGQI